MSGFNKSILTSLVNNTALASFKFREYRYFWLAAAFSNMGMWTLIYSRLWLMHKLTESPLMAGLVTTASLAPVLICAPMGGVISDRINRLKLLRYTRAGFSILTFTTAILILTNLITPWQLIVISIVTGILLSLDIPSRSAMLPTIVPREYLSGAISMYSIVFGGAAVIGPALFAPLVNLWGIEGIFFIIGSAYLLTVFALFAMDPKIHKAQANQMRILDELGRGIKYIKGNRAILGVILIAMGVGMFGMPFETLLPMLADKIITGGVTTYSQLLLYEGIGGLLALLVVAILGPRVHPTRFLVAAGITFGVGLIILSTTTWLQGASLIVGLIGASRWIFGILGVTLIQTLTSDEFRGRVMSIYMFSWGMTAIGGLLVGLLAESIGVPITLALSGIAVLVTTIAVTSITLRQMLVSRSINDYDST